MTTSVIHNVDQRSEEWLKLRSGIPTASQFDQLVTPGFKVKEGLGPESYLAATLAEKWYGGPLPDQYTSFAMDQGTMLEDEAIPWFEFEFDTKVQQVGFVTCEGGKIGCSPDGLIGVDNGLELKCPAIHTHAKYLLRGEVPKDYLAQIHGAMFVTGRPKWTFVSYCRNFPTLVLEVQRDEKIQSVISEALASFLAKMQTGWDKLVRLNGGPPEHLDRPTQQAQPQPENVSKLSIDG